MAIYDYFKEKAKLRFKSKFILAAVLVVIVTLMILAVDVIMELLQLNEIGGQYVKVFWTNFTAQYLTMLGSFILIFLTVFFTNMIIHRVLRKFFEEENVTRVRLPNSSIGI